MSRRRNKIPRDPIEATIESLSHEGRGVARVQGKTVFIDGALPGEIVSFKYSRKRARYAEGYVVEILKASDKRIQPKCQHYGVCGGCSMQHMSAQDQIEHKQSVLLEQFKHIGDVEPETILSPLRSPEWGYRRKARLGSKYVFKKEKLLVGFREKRSNFIADLERCEVLHPEIGLRLPELQALIGSLSIYDQIPQIEIAIGQDTTALIFRHLAPLTEEDLNLFIEFQNNTHIAVYLQSGGPDTVVPLNENTNTDLSYHLDKYDLDIYFQPDDFTQVNFDINNVMIDQVMELLALQEDEEVLDLFCGLGNFSLPMARNAAMVTGIEVSENLIIRARGNASKNKIHNVEFHAMDLMQGVLDAPVFQKAYKKILIDPPRNGALDIINHLNFEAVEKLVYVSCNPATLARDAGILMKNKGLKLKKAGIMDMFPQTSHVESIALFEHI